MLALWQQYFDFLIHPFYSHSKLRLARKSHGDNVAPLFGSTEAASEGPDFLTLMSISWPFYMMRALYTLLTVFISAQILTSEFSTEGLVDLFATGYNYQWEKVMLFWTLLTVIFFPIAAWVAMKFWSLLLSFFAKLFQVEEEHLGEVCDEVARCSLVSHFFLIIPLVGELLKQVSSWIYLYAGCRANLGLTRLQSFIIIVSPIILMATLVLFMVGYFALLLSVLI